MFRNINQCRCDNGFTLFLNSNLCTFFIHCPCKMLFINIKGIPFKGKAVLFKIRLITGDDLLIFHFFLFADVRGELRFQAY